MADTPKTPDFEQALAALEALVEKMEDGDLSLEASLSAFEQGVKLTQECQRALGEAQQRVQVLMQQDGATRLVPFADTGDSPG